MTGFALVSSVCIFVVGWVRVIVGLRVIMMRFRIILGFSFIVGCRAMIRFRYVVGFHVIIKGFRISMDIAISVLSYYSLVFSRTTFLMIITIVTVVCFSFLGFTWA